MKTLNGGRLNCVEYKPMPADFAQSCRFPLLVVPLIFTVYCQPENCEQETRTHIFSFLLDPQLTVFDSVMFQ